MRFIKVLSFLLFLSMTCKVEAQITYKYDAVGNRTARYVLTLKSAKVALPDTVINSKEGIEIEKGLKQADAERSFVLYPNPTRGQVALEIRGNQPNQPGRLLLYSASGVLLKQLVTQGAFTSLNLSAYAAGQYLLVLLLEGKKFEWTIMKEN